MWTEKYRPKSLKDVVGHREIVSQLEAMKRLPLEDIPHLLFIGDAGLGKTSVARAFGNDLGLEFIEFNASKDRGLDFIRDDILSLAKQYSTTKRKIIFLDEFDGITPQAQFSLRALMEKYSTGTLFILSANYRHKIIKEIINRTYEMDFYPLEPKEIEEILKRIMTAENINLPEEKLNAIVRNSNGCPRTALNSLVIAYAGGYVPPPPWDVRKWIQELKQTGIENLPFIVPKVTPQQFASELMNELIKRHDERLLDIILKLGEYALINPNPDSQMLKTVVTVMLWRNRDIL